RAIIGTGTNAIIGTGTNAIIGTGTNAIVGTGLNAIIGTGKPLLIGPVDCFNVSKSTIQVFGRELKVANAAQLAASISGGRSLQVAVFGKLSADRLSQASLRVLADDYVAGSSAVVVAGTVSAADAATGVVHLGKTRIDLNTVRLDRFPAVGDSLKVAGKQPARDGVVLAEAIANL